MTNSRAGPSGATGDVGRVGGLSKPYNFGDGGTVIGPSGSHAVKEIGLDRTFFGIEGLVGPRSAAMAIESI